jgi:hypothetical protein
MLILVEEVNRYCFQYYDSKGDDNRDVSLEEMYSLLALILEMVHDQHDTLKEYWSRDPMCHTLFCSHVVRHNSFFQILPLLHFENDDDAPDRNVNDRYCFFI